MVVIQALFNFAVWCCGGQVKLDIEYPIRRIDMALPPRNKRHAWIRFDTRGYTEEEIQDFETRLDMTERLRIQHKDADGEVLFTSFVWRELLGIRRPLVREIILEFFSMLWFREGIFDLDTADTFQFQLGGIRRQLSWRQSISILELADYWTRISSGGDFLGSVPSYTLIKEPLRRLCHRLISFTISDELIRLRIYKRLLDTMSWVTVGPQRQQVGSMGGVTQVDPEPVASNDRGVHERAGQVLILDGGSDDQAYGGEGYEIPEVNGVMLAVSLVNIYGVDIPRISIFVHVVSISRNVRIIIEHLAKDDEKNVFWSIKDKVRESLLNLKNTIYHSRRKRYFPRLRQDKDHCRTLKNTPYPHQQIRRIRYFGQHSEQTRFTINMSYLEGPIRRRSHELEQPKEHEETGDLVGARKNGDPPGARNNAGNAKKTRSPKKPSFPVSLSCLNPLDLTQVDSRSGSWYQH
ncbi:hypothetical protein Tco_0451073 [Tanacetum coccineum]